MVTVAGMPAAALSIACLSVQARAAGVMTTPRRIMRSAHPPRVLMLTTFDLDEYIFDALHAGASGPPGGLGGHASRGHFHEAYTISD
jgi:DNA-binding NarL/FixJ family response regulator